LFISLAEIKESDKWILGKLEVIIAGRDAQLAESKQEAKKADEDGDVSMAASDDPFAALSVPRAAPNPQVAASVASRAIAEWALYLGKTPPPGFNYRKLLPWYAEKKQDDIPHVKLLVREELCGQASSCSAERWFKVCVLVTVLSHLRAANQLRS
jgi:hypothetical protein